MENPILANRLRLGMTRREFARQAGYSYENCGFYENGLRLSLSDRAAQAFSKILRMTPEQLQIQYSKWKKTVMLP